MNPQRAIYPQTVRKKIVIAKFTIFGEILQKDAKIELGTIKNESAACDLPPERARKKRVIAKLQFFDESRARKN